MSGWNYYKDGDDIYRFTIAVDEEPRNPREDFDGYIGTLNLWWNRYSLGDNEGKGSPDDILSDMVRENVPQEKWTDDDLDYDMSTNQKMMLLQNYILLLPCFIYEHGGMTISCSNDGYPFNDRFDSGMAGFIYTTKGKCEEQWGKIDDDWKKRAYDELVYEVKEYDMYLQNECYGFMEEKYSVEDDSWEDEESCWGFFTDKYGDELIEFFRNEITTQSLISEDDALSEAKAMHEEYLVMDQANTVVAI